MVNRPDAPDRHRDKRRRESPCTPPGKPISIVTLRIAHFQCPVDVLDLWKTNRPTTKLPLVQELRALLEKPLADSEKVPIQQEKYDALFSDLRPDVCSRRDLDTLFTIGVEVPVLAIIFTAVSGPPPSSGTECAFVSFLDANIRGIVELLIPEGTSIRNSNRHTEMRNLRPDFGFLLGTACPFRGEEKGPEDVADPRAELVDKLKADKFGWVYKPAPFMLGKRLCCYILISTLFIGYYCRASEMTLCAILEPDRPRSKARIFDIVMVDLRFRKNRIANIRHLINLSSLFPILAGLVSSLNEFQRIDKYALHSCLSTCTETSIGQIPGSSSVIKTFKHAIACAKVKHLERYTNSSNYIRSRIRTS